MKDQGSNKMIYIVTPVFNRKAFTKDYLEALSRQSVKDFKVIIVDDGSTDGTAEMIEQDFPEVILLKEEGDLWWAEATNVGVRYAMEQGADYVMTLNDDTLPEPDYMEKMIYWSEKEPEALLGALALDHDTQKVIYGGEKRVWKTGKAILLLDTIPLEKQHGLHEVDFFPGRGLLIPVDVFKKIGLYDSKNFPQTIADLDFTYRAANSGFKIYCNYDARIQTFPDESDTVRLRDKKNLRNYYEHLFGIRGGGNLRWFTICAYKNCPRRYFPQFVLIGVTRRIFGYFLK